MNSNQKIKRFLFGSYALPCAIVAFVGTVLLFAFGLLDWKSLLVIGGGILSFAFSAQTQQLEELRLFKELFAKFNERYDEQNKKLNHIYLQSLEAPLLESERDVLFAYFNLCAEEYLYFKKGFIYDEVWVAWKNGMRFFYKNSRIAKLWDEELKNDSYYGFTFED